MPHWSSHFSKGMRAIQKEHGVEDEESAARTALSGLRLVGPYTETSFHDHTAALDRLLPRVLTMDYLSLRDVFYSTIPRDLHRKIFDQTMVMHISGCTYSDIKGIGRDL
jgi:hypothetical protein